MLMWPIRNLGRVISNLSKAGISIDRLRYIMNSEIEQDLPQAKTPDMSKDIVFDNVSYQYDNGPSEILDHVSFTVKAGSTVGILGGTGSGKSTLMYLLDRLYDLKDGTISIGGVDIREMKAEWVRQNVGMVLQEPYLFSRSLGENIKIAEPEADIEEIQHAAKIASLDHAVEHFKEGYETFVGERGVTLSGGQKQRAAIAQMLIRKPPIMVFDDSLSAVDAETDAKIRASLKENTGGSTVILIAHRITTLMNADQIIVMDQGKITETGTHEELIAKNGIYKEIYDLQSRNAEKEVSA
jgi:ATP-binding cassette subfamily B protein